MSRITKAEAEATRLWLASLEMERYDKSYLKRTLPETPVHAPTIVYRDRVKPVDRKAKELRERLFFNAGRYAAGARDKTATSAYETLQMEGEL